MTDQDRTADAVPDSVIEKIAKMLALAESAGKNDPAHRQAEAANALAMAQKLLQQYNLDISTINEHKVAGDLGSVVDTAFAFESKSKSKYGPNRTRTDQEWVTAIAKSVARGSFCRVIINRYDILFIGRDRNVQAAMYMFGNICSQVGEMALVAVRAFNAEQKGRRLRLGIDLPAYVGNAGSANYTVFRNSYLLGAANAIRARLHQQRDEFDRMQQATRPTDGSAPVVRTGLEVVLAADADIDDYIDEKFNDGQARKAREWRAAHPYAPAVYVDERTDAQKATDQARWDEETRAYQAKQDKKERAYFKRYGHHSWEHASRGGPQINDRAYNQGKQDGQHRVSLDAGKVQGGQRKQIGE